MPGLWLPQGTKPSGPVVWRARSECPMPRVAYAMLPGETGSRVLIDSIASQHSGASTGTTGLPTWAGVGGNSGLLLSAAGKQFVVGMFDPAGWTNATLAFDVWIVTADAGVYRTLYTCEQAGGSWSDTILLGNNANLGWHTRINGSSTRHVLAFGTAPVAAKRQLYAFTWNGVSALKCIYLNGLLNNSGTASHGAGTLRGSNTVKQLGHTLDGGESTAYYDGYVFGVWFWDRTLSVTEVAAHYADPWMWLRDPAPRASISLFGTGALTPITGQAAISLAALSSSATSALSLQAQAALALGALTAAGAGALAIAGAGTITLADLAMVAAGKLPIAGSASPALAELTTSGTGTLAIAGVGALTLAELVLNAYGMGPVRAMVATLVTASGDGQVVSAYGDPHGISLSADGVFAGGLG